MFTVHIASAAEGDMEAALDYLLAQDARGAALDLWQAFEKAFASLEMFPLRGHVPPELHFYPDKRIREVHVYAYRLSYRVVEEDVYILFVADGRRDIQQALIERALRFGM